MGDFLQVVRRRRTATLAVVAVTDAIGYMPMIGPYRNGKTYALISDADFDLIAPAAPIGNGILPSRAAACGRAGNRRSCHTVRRAAA